MFNNLICPISSERIDKTVVRVAAILTAVVLLAYAMTGHPIFITALAADYVMRVFIPTKRSPIMWLSYDLAQFFNLEAHIIDKAPKIFAVRIGFTFAVISFALMFVSAPASVMAALILMAFNVLDGVFNICAGCLTYTYVVFPMMRG